MTSSADVWAAAFAKPSKLWQPAPSWKAHEWTPLSVALSRVKDRVGDFGWVEIDLHQDFVTGRIKSALRYPLSDDGTKQLLLFPRPKFWQHLKIIVMGLPEVLVEGNVEGQRLESPGRFFFACTADLDKHYPASVSAAVRLEQAPPPRRRRGPPPKLDQWFIVCGEIARRCVDPRTGHVCVPSNEAKLARDVLQWLEDQNLGAPDSTMREAVRRVCAALRSAQK